jgi:hypothetical protein
MSRRDAYPFSHIRVVTTETCCAGAQFSSLEARSTGCCERFGTANRAFTTILRATQCAFAQCCSLV